MSYQPEDPVEFLETQGWRFKRAGRELVTTCPLCDKPEHLYMNGETGAWKCHRCGAAGNLYQLRQRLGLAGNGRQDGIQSMRDALGTPPKRMIPMAEVEAKHSALLGDPEALEYCTQTRGWSLEIVKRMKLGLRVDARGKWLAYPWLRRGECVGMKFRILAAYQDRYQARFDRAPGTESILYNIDAIDNHDEIILASGESDALALLTLGFENVVATTTGEGSLPASAVDALTAKRRVLVPFDNDAAGQKGAREVGKRIGYDRTFLVPLPQGAKDVNDFVIQGGSRSIFQALLADAVQFDVPSVLSLGQALDRLQAEKETPDWDGVGDDVTPWRTISRMIGRWRGGNLVVVSAPPGTGKTTWALQVVASWAARGVSSLFYCLEMNVEELVQHVLCAHYALAEEQITSEVIEKARRELADWPLYIGGNPRVTRGKELIDLLGQAVRRYGLQLVAFDNLHFLARSVEHRAEEVGTLTKSFKSLAMEYEIPVLLIAQPRKLAPGQVMTPWDLNESVSIFSDADQILLLHREFTGATKDSDAVAGAGAGDVDIMSPLTLVRLAKGRHRRERDGFLHFVGEQHRFRELEPGDVPVPASRPEPRRRRDLD